MTDSKCDSIIRRGDQVYENLFYLCRISVAKTVNFVSKSTIHYLLVRDSVTLYYTTEQRGKVCNTFVHKNISETDWLYQF